MFSDLVAVLNHHDLRHKDRYPTTEENDIYTPFVQDINPDSKDDSTPGNVQVLRDDGRIKHIKVKGLPTEALAAMNQMD